MMANQMAARSDEQPGEHEALVSPFSAAMLTSESGPSAVAEYQDYAGSPMASPFAEAMAVADEGALEALSLEAVIAELEDEDFDEAVQGLVDEAAARHLASSATWSSEAEAPQLAASEVEAWIGGVATRGRSAARTAGAAVRRAPPTKPSTRPSSKLKAAATSPRPGVQSLATEQFLGKLVKKAKGLVKGAVNLAKKGLKAVGKLLPLGKVFDALRKLVSAAAQAGAARWPSASCRRRCSRRPRPSPPSCSARKPRRRTPASRRCSEITEATEAFDARLAEALLAPTEAAVQQLVAEAEAEAEGEQQASPDALAALDAARARLAQELQEAHAGRQSASPKWSSSSPW